MLIAVFNIKHYVYLYIPGIFAQLWKGKKDT